MDRPFSRSSRTWIHARRVRITTWFTRYISAMYPWTVNIAQRSVIIIGTRPGHGRFSRKKLECTYRAFKKLHILCSSSTKRNDLYQIFLSDLFPNKLPAVISGLSYIIIFNIWRIMDHWQLLLCDKSLPSGGYKWAWRRCDHLPPIRKSKEKTCAYRVKVLVFKKL